LLLNKKEVEMYKEVQALNLQELLQFKLQLK